MPAKQRFPHGLEAVTVQVFAQAGQRYVPAHLRALWSRRGQPEPRAAVNHPAPAVSESQGLPGGRWAGVYTIAVHGQVGKAFARGTYSSISNNYTWGFT